MQTAEQANQERRINNTEVINIDAQPDEATIIQSLCPSCEEQGETRLLLTEIPFFKEIVVMSFSCPHCNYRNNEIQPAGSLEDFGVKAELLVTSKDDLDRDIVRSNFASISIPEIQVEIPPCGKGYMSTLEGFMTSFKEDLEINQDYRREHAPEVADQIDEFIRKLDKYIACDPEILPFKFVINDPSGNSNIKNPFAPNPDTHLKIEKYTRSVEQIIEMGYSPENAEVHDSTEVTESAKQDTSDMEKKLKEKIEKETQEKLKSIGQFKYSTKDTDDMFKKVSNAKYVAHGHNFGKGIDTNATTDNEAGDCMRFLTSCSNCLNDGETRMCTCEIPFFKEIIVMSFTCDHCGARSTEVKTGGGVSEKARKITLRVDCEEDMNRDIFKSETAEITIPELDLTLVSGSLGGVYSTIEGLFLKMLETLRDQNPFMGDSSDVEYTSKFKAFCDKLDSYMTGQHPFTMILDDPMDNCWILNPFAPEEDPKIEVLVYERSQEQNEDLGIVYLLEEQERERLEVEKKKELDNSDC